MITLRPSGDAAAAAAAQQGDNADIRVSKPAVCRNLISKTDIELLSSAARWQELSMTRQGRRVDVLNLRYAVSH